jgi:3alpha(or 20beta)-hydroxysteroid dehydrogenase
MGRFDGRTVIVTGAAQGLGASHARGFVAEGASVLLTDVQEDAGRALAGELGEHARFASLDVADREAWAAAVDAAESAFGPVSVLVNNAGIVTTGVAIADSDPADWRRVLDVNLTGTYLGIRAVVGSMRRAGGGAIVNISSAAAFIGRPLMGSYVASKWGVRGLTKCAAMELAADGIRVNSVHPGLVATPAADGQDEILALSRRFAVPRPADPDEVTRVVLFVASDEAGFSTGSEFVVDGGRLLGPVREASTQTEPRH